MLLKFLFQPLLLKKNTVFRESNLPWKLCFLIQSHLPGPTTESTAKCTYLIFWPLYFSVNWGGQGRAGISFFLVLANIVNKFFFFFICNTLVSLNVGKYMNQARDSPSDSSSWVNFGCKIFTALVLENEQYSTWMKWMLIKPTKYYQNWGGDNCAFCIFIITILK